MTQLLNKANVKEMYLNIIKAIYDNTRANIILNGEKLKAFSLRSGTRQEYTFLPSSLKIVLDIPAVARTCQQKASKLERKK